MSSEINNNQSKKLLYFSILIVLAFIILRFVLFYFRSDGFSGLSIILPILAALIIVFGLLTSGCFAAWVYQDCKKRDDDGILWAVIVFVTTPFIGLLLYFLRRSEIKQSCPSCGYKISLKANYCERCGIQIKYKEVSIMNKHTHNLKYIITGIICMVFMITCLTGFIINAAVKGNINTSVNSNKKVWNTGIISMNYETHLDGIWKLDFKSASNGFIKQSNMKINNAANEVLYADIKCDTIPDGATLTLWLVQGDISKSVDVTNLSSPFEYSLNEFKNGKIYVRLQINGVENVKSEIYIK